MKKYPSIIKQTVISCLLIAISQTAFSANNKSQQPLLTLKVPVELKNQLPLSRQILCSVYQTSAKKNKIADSQAYIKQNSGDINEVVAITFPNPSSKDLQKATYYECKLFGNDPSQIAGISIHFDSIKSVCSLPSQSNSAWCFAPNTKFRWQVSGKINWNK